MGAKVIIEKYYTKLNLDFHVNKRIIEEVALIPSKPLRNKIAGFITHLMKRLQRSTVRGISIKLQEEERERRDNYVPDVSALEQDVIEVDAETKEMLKMMDFQSIPGLQMTTAARGAGGAGGYRTETEHSVKKCEDACPNYLAINVGITFAYSWAC